MARRLTCSLLLCLWAVSVSGSYVYVEIVARTPDLEERIKIGCQPAAFTGESPSLTDVQAVPANPQDACTPLIGSNYAQKTVILRRGSCTFKTKVNNARSVGAAAIIVVNDEPDFPVKMTLAESKIDPDLKYDDETIENNGIGIPVCMAFSSAWDELAGTGVSGVRLDWSGFRKYFARDERLPQNDIVPIEYTVDDTTHTIPAAQATFNPAVGSFTGSAVQMRLDDSCYDGADCAVCWTLPQQVENHADLSGKVALFYLEAGVDNCLSWNYEVAWLAQQAGAKALIYINTDETLWTWIPWMTPVRISIPTFNVFKSDGSEVLVHLNALTPVQIVTPALQLYPTGCQPAVDTCIASGPAYALGGTNALDLTAVMLADYTIAGEPATRLCSAGQAVFNPSNLPAQDTAQSFFAFNAPVSVTYFPAECSVDTAVTGDGDCSQCEDDETVLQNMGVLEGRVALVMIDEVGCVGSWHKIVDGAKELGAVGVLFGSSNENVGALTAESSYEAAIPSFIIGNEDATWLHGRALRYSTDPSDDNTRRADLEGVLAYIPQIEDGSAPAYNEGYAQASFTFMEQEAMGQTPADPAPIAPNSDPEEEDAVRMTRITVMDDGEQKYTVTAAVARFMSPTYPSVIGDAVWLHWWHCGSLNTCGACKADICGDIRNLEDMNERVALIWQDDIPCLSGNEAVEAVHCAQENGALAVVFVSAGEVRPLEPAEAKLPAHMPPDLCLDGRYRAFCMPVFSISTAASTKLRLHVTCADAEDGTQQACQEQLSSEPITRIELPGHHKNPSPFSASADGTADGFLSTADEQTEKSKLKLPVWGIVLVVLAVLAGFAAVGIYIYRLRKRRLETYMASAEGQVTDGMLDNAGEEGGVVISADPSRFRGIGVDAARGKGKKDDADANPPSAAGPAAATPGAAAAELSEAEEDAGAASKGD